VTGWDADDNGDGHLDAPADDPRNPPGNEPDYRYEQQGGDRMQWHLTVTQLPKSGMWRAVATAEGFRLEATRASRDAAVMELRQLVDQAEGMVGVRS